MVIRELHLQRKTHPHQASPDSPNMSNWLQHLPKYWRKRSAITWLLWPIEFIYKLLISLRKLAFATGFFKRHQVNATVIVVGNIVAGGGGKTPLTIAIAQRLKAQGLKLGIVSRGYGRSNSSLQVVSAQSLVSEVGDEPLMIFQKCGVPVVVGSQRAEAAQFLLQQFPEVRVLICDDGLQHMALHRDIEICVMDAMGLGNGHLLPAGPLREPWPRPVDLLLHTHQRSLPEGFESHRELSAYGLTSQGHKMPLENLKSEKIEVVSGIAKPEAFIAMLEQAQLQISHASALPDHDDFAHWQPLHPEMPLLCTEKDAVKLWARFPHAVAIPLIFQAEDAFWKAFDQLFQSRHRYH
jgi:tetraacyldisaccharide 4'-kinase